MVNKAITQSDLNNLEKSIKLDITKEQQQIRHNQNNELQKYYNMVDDLKTDSALSKQSFTTMTKSIEKLEQVVLDGLKEIREEFKAMNTVFIKKDELEPIKEKQKSHDEIINRVVWGIIIAFISLIAGIVGLSKYM